MKSLPNILTGGRLILSLFVFAALATAAGAMPWLSERLSAEARLGLIPWAFAAFVVAAVTDFFDGWLARRWNVTSVWGAILDPIADKVLVAAAVLGLLAAGPGAILLPATLILLREFTVSALREVIAGRGLRLPVTLLAKWKTTLQLVALGAEIFVSGWRGFGLAANSSALPALTLTAHVLLCAAALVTVITGAQYLSQARKALGAAG